ncbi:MAG: hypothetical protein EBV13_04280 [Actinobacteria bacterium]|nr:hypothetical protein [Actinomycetota bacterium]
MAVLSEAAVITKSELTGSIYPSRLFASASSWAAIIFSKFLFAGSRRDLLGTFNGLPASTVIRLDIVDNSRENCEISFRSACRRCRELRR